VRNITIDNSNFTAILYHPLISWAFGSYNATNYNPPQTGTLASGRNLTAGLNFTFPRAYDVSELNEIEIRLLPELAYAFYYYGIKVSDGARYLICIDCFPHPIETAGTVISGLNSSDNGGNIPVSCYHKHLGVTLMFMS
jgi:hypothetical protein